MHLHAPAYFNLSNLDIQLPVKPMSKWKLNCSIKTVQQAFKTSHEHE